MCTLADPVMTYGALRAEAPRRAIEAAVDDGSLIRLRRGVYAREGACEPVTAAARHGGPLACVTAARHLGLWVLDESDTVHVWMRGHGRAHAHAPCSCTAHWDDDSAIDAFGFPSVPRILVQILACRGVEEFFVVLESALRTPKITEEELVWLRRHVNDAGRGAIAFARATSVWDQPDARGTAESVSVSVAVTVCCSPSRTSVIFA